MTVKFKNDIFKKKEKTPTSKNNSIPTDLFMMEQPPKNDNKTETQANDNIFDFNVNNNNTNTTNKTEEKAFKIPDNLDFNKISGNFQDNKKKADNTSAINSNKDNIIKDNNNTDNLNINAKISKTPSQTKTKTETFDSMAGILNLDFSVGTPTKDSQKEVKTTLDPSCKYIYNI